MLRKKPPFSLNSAAAKTHITGSPGTNTIAAPFRTFNATTVVCYNPNTSANVLISGLSYATASNA